MKRLSPIGLLLLLLLLPLVVESVELFVPAHTVCMGTEGMGRVGIERCSRRTRRPQAGGGGGCGSGDWCGGGGAD